MTRHCIWIPTKKMRKPSACLRNIPNRKVQLIKEFAQNFYPLSEAAMVLCGKEMKNLSWTDGPAPWEGACV